MTESIGIKYIILVLHYFFIGSWYNCFYDTVTRKSCSCVEVSRALKAYSIDKYTGLFTRHISHNQGNYNTLLYYNYLHNSQDRDSETVRLPMILTDQSTHIM